MQGRKVYSNCAALNNDVEFGLGDWNRHLG